MDPATLGLLAIGGSAFSGIGNAIGNFFSTRETNRTNEQMQRNQQAYDLDMWNKSNAYNTPQAQMERYKAAGLNPNLIYGSGSASAGNAGPIKTESPAYYHAPPISLPDVGAIVNQYADYQIKQQNLETLKWNTVQARQDALNKLFGNSIEYGDIGKYLHALPNGGVSAFWDDKVDAPYGALTFYNSLQDTYANKSRNINLALQQQNIELAKANTQGSYWRNVGTAYNNEILMKTAKSFYWKMAADAALQAAGQASKFLY